MTRPAREWALAGVAALGVAALTAWFSAPARGTGDADMAVAQLDMARGGGRASSRAPEEVRQALAAPTETREPWPAMQAGAAGAWGRARGAALEGRAAAAAASAAAASAPSAPAAPPPLAWRFVGRIVEGASIRAILVHATQGTVVVRAGETIDGQWRVESMGEDGVDLLWLPAGLPQRLAASR